MRKNYTFFNITSLLLIFISIFILAGIYQSNNSTVTFEDPGLEQAVRDTIKKEEGIIESKDVINLQDLDANGYEIKSLEGIDALENLRSLNLEDNFVESVSPLSDLTKLRILNLRNNEITNLEEIDFEDILFLHIRDLSLRHNVKRDNQGNETRLSDISLLGQMVSLRKLELRDNHIEDLDPISNLRNLRKLDIRENRFDTIKPLETLTKLEKLNIRDNQIDSLEPLRYLSHLKYLNIHSVEGITSLDPINELVNLETLIMRNVSIEDDGEFLKNLTKLQRFNAIDADFETINPNIIESLLQKGALQGEVRPIRMLQTLETPILSRNSGFYGENFELKISTDSENGNIYYTLDGSEPTFQSDIYTEPIKIEENGDSSLTVVRAKVLSENNTMSDTVTKSYFVHKNFDERFDLPIFSLVTDPDNLFDDEVGIYTNENAHNRGGDWERPVHLDFFEADGSLELSQNAGIRIHGGTSRGASQKSLRLYAKSEYDDNDIFKYEFFDDLKAVNSNKNIDSFKRLLLRNSGNDRNQTMFNDGLIQNLISTLNTLDTQGYQPSVVFINGKYYGIHNIRERMDEYYLASHYDIDLNDIVILENKNNLYRGSNNDVFHYDNMIRYIEEHGVEDDIDFKHVGTMMDIENYIDYFATEIYFGNADWPGNNIKFWRKTTNEYDENAPYGHDGRWRWMIFDMDFGLYRSDELWGDQGQPLNHNHNTIQWVMTEVDGVRGNREWPNFLFRSLMANKQFENDFINRMNDLMNSYFSEKVTSQQIDESVKNLENEMPRHINRWEIINSLEDWNMHINRKYTFSKERPQILRGFIMDEFEIEDTITINIENENEMGYVRLNTIDINSELPGNTNDDVWSGTYFTDIPITIEAVPKDGYHFSHWEGIDAQEKSTEITPTTDLNIRAVFTQ